MGYGIKLKVWGDYACFTRPEMKVERVSYDVMTPSAARGILEAIYWKPAIRWIIDRIIVVNPILFESIRRNELLGVISQRSIENALYSRSSTELCQSTDAISQKSALILKNVCYYIDAHFVMTDKAGPTDTEDKHYAIAVRRMKKGQCFHRAYFGCREFPVQFCYIEDDEILDSYYQGKKIDLGYMLWDIDYMNDNNSIFYRPVMENGVIEVPDKLEVQ